MEIKVLGSGCASCEKLYALTREAAKELGINADIRYVTDMTEIVQAGVMNTPALVVDGKVKAMGRVPGRKEIRRMITG